MRGRDRKLAGLINPVNPTPGQDVARVLIGTPTLGVVRIEWHNAMSGIVAPPNWSLVRSAPVQYTVADAQNILVDSMLEGGFKALILIEDDTIPPPNAFLEFDRWIHKMDHDQAPPVVSGLYHIKGSAETRKGKTGGIELLGPEPLAYRGSGTRAFRDWDYGDVIWVSGVPTGALCVHRKVFEAWVKEPDVETYQVPGYPRPIKKIFSQPVVWWRDENGGVHMGTGTTDLHWSSETIKRDIFTKAGFKKWAKREYPYIIDTALHFGHVDRATGVVY